MDTQAIKTIAARILLIGGVFALAAAALSVRGEEPGITFATKGIDLKIDSSAFYNGAKWKPLSWKLKDLNPTSDQFFEFDDVKPGDYGKTVISMHVKKSPAYLCLDFKNLEDEENGVNEPESEDDADGAAAGELSDTLEFFAWRDDGDNVFEKGEKPVFGTSTAMQAASVALASTTYIVGDSKSYGSCGVNQTRYVGIYWCMGDLTVDLANAQISCDGSSLSNETQTDSMTVDLSIRAVPSKENPKFVCGGKPPKPDPKPDPKPKPKPKPGHGDWYKPNINYDYHGWNWGKWWWGKYFSYDR